MTPSKTHLVPALCAVLALALLSMAPGALAKPHAAKVRSFHGTVGAVARDHHSFRLRRAGKVGVRIRVARSTKLAKGVRLKKGLSLNVRARRIRGGWVATKITRANPRGKDDAGAGDDPGADEDAPSAGEDPASDEDDPGTEDGPGEDDPAGAGDVPSDQGASPED